SLGECRQRPDAIEQWIDVDGTPAVVQEHVSEVYRQNIVSGTKNMRPAPMKLLVLPVSHIERIVPGSGLVGAHRKSSWGRVDGRQGGCTSNLVDRYVRQRSHADGGVRKR